MAVNDLFYRVASGPKRVRGLMTPIGLILFFAFIGALIWGSMLLDRWLGFGWALPRGVELALSIPLMAIGAFLSAWSILIFLQGRGTPVPFNPPRELVMRGPYRYVRNPMLTGLFMQFLGLGVFLGSAGMTLIVTPAFAVASVSWLKLVEEPELERRLGSAYVEYKRATPMFLPRMKRTARDTLRRTNR
jgi:protein-S-isoprenylcysteine O-methyltransferase Ste14